MSSQRTLRRAVSDEDKERRREEILAAAREVFAEKGYHETTVADVARGTELSYGVVYWYFSSKEELFRALMSAEAEALRERIVAALEPPHPHDTASLLRSAVRATFEHFAQNPEATRLLFLDPPALGEGFGRHLSGIFASFTANLEIAFEESQRSGETRPLPTRLVAFSCASLITQLALRRQRTDDGLDLEAAVDFTVDLLLDGVREPAGLHPRPAQGGAP